MKKETQKEIEKSIDQVGDLVKLGYPKSIAVKMLEIHSKELQASANRNLEQMILEKLKGFVNVPMAHTAKDAGKQVCVVTIKFKDQSTKLSFRSKSNKK